MSELHDRAVTARSLAGQVASTIDTCEILGGATVSPKTVQMTRDAVEKAERAAVALLAVRDQLAGQLGAES